MLKGASGVFERGGKKTPEVDEAQVTVDANHPLAGETLTYEIEILEVREATRAELAKGHPLPPGTSHTEVEDHKR